MSKKQKLLGVNFLHFRNYSRNFLGFPLKGDSSFSEISVRTREKFPWSTFFNAGTFFRK